MKLGLKLVILFFILTSLSIWIVLLSYQFTNNTDSINLRNVFIYCGFIISHLIVFYVAHRLKIFNISKPMFKIRESLFSLIIGLLVFFVFYFQFSFFSLQNITKPSILSLVYIIMLAPIIEEVFFKIVILNNLLAMKKMNAFLAILITAICFTITHVPHVYFSHFALALITSIYYVKNKNIYYSILIHASYNFFVELNYLLV